MKKILVILMMLLGLSCVSEAYDSEACDFDRNYELADIYKGTYYYVDNTSIVTVNERYPFYQLAAGVLINHPDGEASYQIYTWQYIYNRNCDKRKMYVLSDDKSLSIYIPRFNEKGNDFAIPVNRNAGEIVWENYYHTVFYEK